jgi:hypothetical protein
MSDDIELLDHERTPCEIWSRVMGYHRPLSCFNAGKQSEHRERKLFREVVASQHAVMTAEDSIPAKQEAKPEPLKDNFRFAFAQHQVSV